MVEWKTNLRLTNTIEMLGSEHDLVGRSPKEPLSEISTAIIQAELARRQDALPLPKPACGSGQVDASYNTSLHVAALIIILVLSTAACSFPIIARRFPGFPVPHHFLFVSRHFGTGVLIATAFVHLLPTAFISLTDPCLPSFWNEKYPAMPGLIAMTAVLAVVGIEMFFATRGAGHIHSSDYDALPLTERHIAHEHPIDGHLESYIPARGSPKHKKYGTKRRSGSIYFGDLPESTEHLVACRSPSLPNNSPQARGYHDDATSDDSDLDLNELDPVIPALNSHPRPPSPPHPDLLSPSHSELPNSSHPHVLTSLQSPAASASHIGLSAQQVQKKLLLQCLLLEAGILFHSIFIGMAVSVATGPPFLILLIAISFHQTFEGFALGSRISTATSDLPTRSPKPWFMALAYGLTTPIGQAIGLAVHGLYDPRGQGGLLLVGVMNAVSSGLLLFAGMVELLAEDFLSEGSYRSLRGWRRVEACGAVVGGCALMALVGAWA